VFFFFTCLGKWTKWLVFFYLFGEMVGALTYSFLFLFFFFFFFFFLNCFLCVNW
jgi:hypothetical protein